MQHSRWRFHALIFILFFSGLLLSIFRHIEYQVPWLPGESLTTWSLEARVELLAGDDPVSVRLARPTDQPGFTRINESTASPGFGVVYQNTPDRIEWTKRSATGTQTLFYRTEFLVDNAQTGSEPPAPSLPTVVWQEPYNTAAEQLLQSVHARSADPISFAQQLFLTLKQKDNPTGQNISLLKNAQPDSATLAVKLLNQAEIKAATIRALRLEDGRRRQQLVPLIRVWVSDNKSVIFDPRSGQQGLPENHIIWQSAGLPLLEVIGGENSSVNFAIIRQQESITGAVRAQHDNSHDLINFSIHSLPLEEQALFKTILLLPVGALVVCLLRILVGLRTSGTFMPVLIALAFIQTSLVTGLVGFLLIVFTGLMLRGYLSQLNLLLVARISAVIISVIAIISLFSLVSYQVGLSEGLKVTFFPMIILSWTIERMSILWEEEGTKEVMIQGGGSLLTAIIAYLAMTNEWVRHLTFNFLGMQLILLSFILALGNYTGYRLFELFRFKSMVKDKQNAN
ncbi:inactive transglutaminase family protein [Gayadomonas joobiniege]|uniref:inactive transglutaminase family protein n=1 Tax=Gayadomonas joobiniege TaxID=1234606 RepID=UPI00037C6B70|nr:inactive transglutaminase family protein [Gayadomonas joobiniege]